MNNETSIQWSIYNSRMKIIEKKGLKNQWLEFMKSKNTRLENGYRAINDTTEEFFTKNNLWGF